MTYVPGVPMQAYLDEAATEYDGLSLDLHIAMFPAHAQVYRAHGSPVTALVCDDYCAGPRRDPAHPRHVSPRRSTTRCTRRGR